MSTITRPDILVFGPDSSLIMAVDVKGGSGASPEWAADYRRELFSHGMIPKVPFYVLALPNALYFWKDANTDQEVLPDYTLDAQEALAGYVDQEGSSLAGMDRYGLELLVADWLYRLVSRQRSKETTDPGMRWLTDSGLLDSIRNGWLLREPTS